ncbi:MAG: hypothetical protein AUF79_01080 [Crenarchaeota archaeon 13_1_20CM_2_51_8]|nr:MAG: hypothetical protein AUF79_01080 [Crenarchaeota archaeon 13_1_20CM_2_51_8]
MDRSRIIRVYSVGHALEVGCMFRSRIRADNGRYYHFRVSAPTARTKQNGCAISPFFKNPFSYLKLIPAASGESGRNHGLDGSAKLAFFQPLPNGFRESSWRGPQIRDQGLFWASLRLFHKLLVFSRA